MDKSTEVAAPITKVATAIGSAAAVKADELATATGATVHHLSLLDPTWSNIAAAMATLYTLCLIMEWWWKRFWRPLAVSFGWMKPPKRYVLTEKEMRDEDNLTQL